MSLEPARRITLHTGLGLVLVAQLVQLQQTRSVPNYKLYPGRGAHKAITNNGPGVDAGWSRLFSFQHPPILKKPAIKFPGQPRAFVAIQASRRPRTLAAVKYDA